MFHVKHPLQGKAPPAGTPSAGPDDRSWMRNLGVLWIAELGSYTGYASSGGPPGPLVLARGFKEVLAAVRVIEALAKT